MNKQTLMQALKYLASALITLLMIGFVIGCLVFTYYAVKAPNLYALLQHLREHPNIDSCYPFGEYLHLTLKEDTNITLFQQQLKTTFPHLDWQPITPTIEDSFIRLMEEKGNI